jgi:hypothetical protein
MISKHARFFYDNIKEAIVIKLMTSRIHKMVIIACKGISTFFSPVISRISTVQGTAFIQRSRVLFYAKATKSKHLLTRV